MKHGTNLFWQILLVLLVVLGTFLRMQMVQDEGLCRSAPLNPRGMFRDREAGACAITSRRDPKFTDVLIRHIRQKAFYAC